MTLRKSLFALFFGAAALAGAVVPALADHRPHRVPQEAITACDGKTAGDTCQVTFGDHTMDGSCRTPPGGTGALACMPDGPPPEAILACKGLTSGDSCSMTMPDGDEIDGTCSPGPGDKPLACAPNHRPPQ